MGKRILLYLIALVWINNAHSQNVGIGTVNPTGRLHIDLTTVANEDAIIISDDTDPVVRFRRNASDRAFFQLLADDFKIATAATNDTGRLIFRTNGTDRMYVGANGNVGIAVPSPQSRLHIGSGGDAGLSANGYLMLGNETGENIVFDNNEILARNNGAAAILFLAREGSTVQLGNGTPATGTKLHISTGSDVGLTDALSGYLMIGAQAGSNIVVDNNEVQARNNGAAANLFLQAGGGNVRIGDGDFLSSHRLGVAGDVVVTGNLRVGTTPLPNGYSFGVDGRMLCTEVLVRLVPNWPDYVFDERHRLPDLNEVQQFIKENKRLPGIPSAADIEKNGLRIGEMQKMQMEKIEELTLYILELKKEIDTLKKDRHNR
jgi:hypothetical protein